MNKKILSIFLVVMLIASLSICLISCAKEDTSDTQKLEVDTDNKLVIEYSETRTVHPYDSITIRAPKNMAINELLSNITFAQTSEGADKGAVQIDAKAVGNNQFNIFLASSEPLTVGAEYLIRVLDERLTIIDPYTKQDLGTSILIINVQDKETTRRDLGDEVIQINKAYITNNEDDGNLKTLMVETAKAGIDVSMGDILYTGQEAYKVAGVENTNVAGVQKVAYVLPDYEKVYNALVTTSQTNLTEGNIDFNNIEEAVDIVTSTVATAGFNVGPVGIDTSLNNDTVTLKLTVKATDILGDKDGENNLGLIFTFIIKSKVDLKTDINIGATIGKNSEIKLIADFYNTLSFSVALEDGATITESAELDAIISKIKAMVQKTNEDVVSIPVFNWTVPIGSGVADVSFQVNAALDLAFSGKLEVKATATSGYTAEVKYNPATGDKDATVTEMQGLAFDSVSVSFDGDATIYLGINAIIKFNLLAGVISLGLEAEVGNYNKIYGTIGTTNLIEEDVSAVYGYYFEGGIYYDVKFLYSVAKITSGEKSFFKGRQEKKLYESGSPIVITEAKVTETIYVGDVAKALDIIVNTKNLVTGEELTDVRLEDLTKIIDLDLEDNIIIENGTIRVDGTITKDSIKVKVDSIEVTISISNIKEIDGNTDIETLAPGEYRRPDGTIIVVKAQ